MLSLVPGICCLNMKVVRHGELTFVTVQSRSLRILFQVFGLNACEDLRICDELRGVLTYVELSLKYSSAIAAGLHCARSMYLQMLDAPVNIDLFHNFGQRC